MSQENEPVGDLKFVPLKDLSWTSSERSGALDKVFKYVSSEAERAINWYLSKKKSKRIWARVLRVAAILLGTLAALIPILSQIPISEGKAIIRQPAWASAAIVLAGALVLLDRFFGFSSSWMRFLTTEIKIRSALQAFQMDWEIQRAALKGANPTDEQVQDMLERCKTFLVQINKFLENELAAWKQEFQAALKQIGEVAQAQIEPVKQGGVNIEVTNGDQCDNGWELSIDGGSLKHYSGKTAALRDLTPGVHTIRVAGKINGKVVKAEKAVTIPAGSTVEIELEMT